MSKLVLNVKYLLLFFFNCGQVLQFVAHSRYHKGALTQKRSFLVICTTFRSDFHVSWKNQNKNSTLNLSFNALSKWHEPDIKFSPEFATSRKIFLFLPYFPNVQNLLPSKTPWWYSYRKVLGPPLKRGLLLFGTNLCPLLFRDLWNLVIPFSHSIYILTVGS